MRKRKEFILYGIAAVAILAAVHVYVTFFTPASSEPAVKVINIPKGASFRVVAANLESAGVVRDADSLSILARLFGAYKKIKAGEYEFNTAMTTYEVLGIMIKGKVKTYPVVIPEGYNISEIAAMLASFNLVDEEEFKQRAMDRKLAARLGVDGPTLEGYLFPDTYNFTKGLTSEEMLGRMAARFREVYDAEIAPMAQKRGVAMKTVVTLASIIEKETGAAHERPLISAVFHNRLKKRIKLQSDPTVIYAIKDFSGNLTRSHLVTRSPYNTYVNHGLPPGPIANPGLDSLRAALNPVESDYLFFVSKNDGTHHFSRSLKEHNNAVNIYQKKRSHGAAG